MIVPSTEGVLIDFLLSCSPEVLWQIFSLKKCRQRCLKALSFPCGFPFVIFWNSLKCVFLDSVGDRLSRAQSLKAFLATAFLFGIVVFCRCYFSDCRKSRTRSSSVSSWGYERICARIVKIIANWGHLLVFHNWVAHMPSKVAYPTLVAAKNAISPDHKSWRYFFYMEIVFWRHLWNNSAI